MATNKDDGMTEERYYVAGDCILDRLQPELCCPFDCEDHAKHALEMYAGELTDYQWVRIDSLNGRRVDVERVRNLLAELEKIDAIPLSEMQLYENGQKIEISPEAIEEWLFVGLSNRAFIEMEIWNDTPDDYAEKFDAAADAIRQMVTPVWIEFYGERCTEFEPECLCCQKWAELDKLLENPMR